ncbi:hypothetical protein KC887_00680 [Candidatus Kaiserbacteria bacterium]|nr:hypothetical protein [Candidatus Kaiserbacteria bacterium]
MSEIVPIPKSSGCDFVGGVFKAYATESENITAVAVTDGEITGFTMASAGQWGKLEFDDQQNVAFFNENGERNGNVVRVNGTGLMSFVGLTAAKIVAANKAKACCGLVLVWFHYDGTRRVQGIDVNPGDNTWKFSNQLPRIIPNALSGTGAEESRLEYNVTHQGSQLSSTTDLTDTEIEAL